MESQNSELNLSQNVSENSLQKNNNSYEAENLLLKRTIESIQIEINNLKSNIFILKEKNESLSQENSMINNELSKKNKSITEYIVQLNNLNLKIKA